MLKDNIFCLISKTNALTGDLPSYIASDIESVTNESLKEQKYATYRLLNKGLVLLGYSGGLSEKILKKGQDNKPYFDDLCVSLTHTKGLSAVCFFSQNVGVDVERISRFEKFKLPQLMGLGYHLPKETYALEWTKKEASFKVDGGAVFSPVNVNSDNFNTLSIKVINGEEEYFLTLSAKSEYKVKYICVDDNLVTNYDKVEQIIL